jgi:SAM-dependent methyltransferase
MHQSSLDKMKWFKENYLKAYEGQQLQILDVGSYNVNGTYKEILADPAWHYTGADVAAGPNVDIVLQDPYNWHNIPSNSYDVLVSGQVFEHVEWFWITILEMRRVLKPGGICCILAPAAGYEHKFPVDCWRFYPDGFAAIAKFADLEALHVATQWEPLNYPDGSDQWKDSILVCRKPATQNLKARIRGIARHKLLSLALRM